MILPHHIYYDIVTSANTLTWKLMFPFVFPLLNGQTGVVQHGSKLRIIDNIEDKQLKACSTEMKLGSILKNRASFYLFHIPRQY